MTLMKIFKKSTTNYYINQHLIFYRAVINGLDLIGSFRYINNRTDYQLLIKGEPIMSNVKRVYLFGGGMSEGKADMKNLLGGKGANLAEMSNLGIPVPAGFTITTEVCMEYYRNNQKYPDGLKQEVNSAITQS